MLNFYEQYHSVDNERGDISKTDHFDSGPGFCSLEFVLPVIVGYLPTFQYVVLFTQSLDP